MYIGLKCWSVLIGQFSFKQGLNCTFFKYLFHNLIKLPNLFSYEKSLLINSSMLFYLVR